MYQDIYVELIEESLNYLINKLKEFGEEVDLNKSNDREEFCEMIKSYFKEVDNKLIDQHKWHVEIDYIYEVGNRYYCLTIMEGGTRNTENGDVWIHEVKRVPVTTYKYHTINKN